MRKDTATDTLVVAGSAVGHLVPTFVVGLLAIYLLAVQLGLLPGHVVMPAMTLGLFYAGRAARLVRASVLDVLD